MEINFKAYQITTVIALAKLEQGIPHFAFQRSASGSHIIGDQVSMIIHSHLAIGIAQLPAGNVGILGELLI
jgi:hypothetical protein